MPDPSPQALAAVEAPVALSFFLRCDAPRTTNQQKGHTVTKDGHVRTFKKGKTKAAESTFTSLLLPHQPASPVTGPVSLYVSVTWPWNDGDLDTKAKRAEAERLGRVPHTGLPDCSNWIKSFEDCLVALRFIEDDRKVVDLHVVKWRGTDPGVYVEIRALDVAAGRVG